MLQAGCKQTPCLFCTLAISTITLQPSPEPERGAEGISLPLLPPHSHTLMCNMSAAGADLLGVPAGTHLVLLLHGGHYKDVREQQSIVGPSTQRKSKEHAAAPKQDTTKPLITTFCLTEYCSASEKISRISKGRKGRGGPAFSTQKR